jgi:hypothetical protein
MVGKESVADDGDKMIHGLKGPVLVGRIISIAAAQKATRL